MTGPLSQEAFDRALARELRRSVRAHAFLTLVVLELRRRWHGLQVPVPDVVAEQIATIVGGHLRDTDLVGAAGPGVVRVALVDADFDAGRLAVARVLERLAPYAVSGDTTVTAYAASCPTHAVEPMALSAQAALQPVGVARLGAPTER